MKYLLTFLISLDGVLFYCAVFLFGPNQLGTAVYLFCFATVLSLMNPRPAMVYLLFGLTIINFGWTMFLIQRTIAIHAEWFAVAATGLLTVLCTLTTLFSFRIVEKFKTLSKVPGEK